MAGVVAAVGNSVTAFDVGDVVYGCAGSIPGALADYMPCDARLLAPEARVAVVP